MKCHSVQKKLSAYQDRELETREEEQVRSHLLSCRECREQYGALGRVWHTLRGLGEIHPDPWFYQQLIRKIREPREQGWLPTLRHVFQVFRVPATVSIILIIGLVAGGYLGGILARYDLFPSQNTPASYSQEALFTSMKVFDLAPPGTVAEGYFRMVAYKGNDSK
jgi:predicted anti-sigma-YlaC factor YlaD